MSIEAGSERSGGCPPAGWSRALKLAGRVRPSARRTAAWTLTLAFSLTAWAICDAESFYTIFVVKMLDAEFRQVPWGAFGLSLLGCTFVALFGMLLFAGSLTLLKRRPLYPTSLGVYVSAILGGIYVTIPFLFFADDGSTPAALFWAWAVLFPIISARVALRGPAGD